MVDNKSIPTRDFKDTPYYKEYDKMINSYCEKIIVSIITSQGIDNEPKYTRGDVLKEVLKFVRGDMKEFKDLVNINPNRELLDKEQIKKMVEEQAKNLGIN